MKKKNVKDKQKKKVSKATKGMEEFYRKKKVGDKLKFAFLTVIILFSFAMLMAFIAILLMNVDTKKFYEEAYTSSVLHQGRTQIHGAVIARIHLN